MKKNKMIVAILISISIQSLSLFKIIDNRIALNMYENMMAAQLAEKRVISKDLDKKEIFHQGIYNFDIMGLLKDNQHTRDTINNLQGILLGCWEYKVQNYCQEILFSYKFRNDTLITYHNEYCQGGTSSLYKYTISNDSIIAQELETYSNIEGFIKYHHINRNVILKIPQCWFTDVNSCFEYTNRTNSPNGKFEFSKLKNFNWYVKGKVLKDGKWINKD